MNFTNVILVDGIFGAGKSTLTSLISDYLNQLNISNVFYEEEGPENPFYIDYCEDVKGVEETEKFIQETINRWKKFKSSIFDEKKLYVIESSFFQNSLRMLFNNCYPKKEIEKFHNEIISILKHFDPILIYLHLDDVSRHINKIWKIRGESWKNEACIEQDQDTLYCEKNKIYGENSTILLWDNYQKITDELFEKTSFRKEVFYPQRNNWDDIHDTIFNYLKEEKSKSK